MRDLRKTFIEDRSVGQMQENIRVFSKEVTRTLDDLFTPPTTYAMDITASTTAPVKGSVIEYDKAYFWTIGQYMTIIYNYSHTAAGTNGSGTYFFPLPDGYSFDDSILTINTTAAKASIIGIGEASATTSRNFSLIVTPYSSTKMIARGYNAAFSATDFNSTSFSYANADFRLSLNVTFPFVRR